MASLEEATNHGTPATMRLAKLVTNMLRRAK
jgi:hypothetical protein